jgi:hypothetical protein
VSRSPLNADHLRRDAVEKAPYAHRAKERERDGAMKHRHALPKKPGLLARLRAVLRR